MRSEPKHSEPVAQLVEHFPFKEGVESSILSRLINERTTYGAVRRRQVVRANLSSRRRPSADRGYLMGAQAC